MLEENIYCVYQHIRLDKNEVFYVGIGGEDRPFEKIGRNKHWRNIVNINLNYEINILFKNLTWSQCCRKEKWYVKLYGREDLGLGSLCNLTDGGDGTTGRIFSKDALKRIGDHSKNRIRKRGYKANLSVEGRKSKSDYMKNRVISKETCEKIAKSRIGTKHALGHKVSDNSKNRISKAHSIYILKYTLEDVFIEEILGIKPYCRLNPIFNSSGIIRCCKGKTKSYKGFKWKYKI